MIERLKRINWAIDDPNHAMEHIPELKAIASELSKDGSPRAIKALIQYGLGIKRSWDAQKVFLETLGKKGKAVVPALIEHGLKSWDTETAGTTAELLGKLGDERAIEPLFEKGASAREHGWSYDQALAKIGTQKVLDMALAGLDSVSEHKRMFSLAVLEEMPRESAAKPIIDKILENEDEHELHNFSLRVLEKIGGESAVEAIVKHGALSESRETQSEMTHYLRDERHFPYVMQLVSHKDPKVREFATAFVKNRQKEEREREKRVRERPRAP
jgi:HEAT repeat protein